MKLKLTKKLAEVLDGVDLSNVSSGDEMDLPRRDAAMLIAEGWAVPVEEVAGREERVEPARLRNRAADRRRTRGRS